MAEGGTSAATPAQTPHAGERPSTGSCAVPVVPAVARLYAAQAKECMVCMYEPRRCLFACGHLVCCQSCTDDLLATAAQRVPKNACPVCRAVIVVVDRGDEDDDFATYRPPHGPVPAAISIPKLNTTIAPEFPPGTEVVLSFAAAGLTGLRLVHPTGPEGTSHVINSVTPGSPADEQRAPIGGVLVRMNGQNIDGGWTRNDVVTLAAARPLEIVVRAPSESARRGALAALHSPRQSQLPAQQPLQAFVSGRHMLAVNLPASAAPGDVLLIELPPSGDEPTTRVQITVPHTAFGSSRLAFVPPADWPWPAPLQMAAPPASAPRRRRRVARMAVIWRRGCLRVCGCR
jgi:hypothetical protein